MSGIKTGGIKVEGQIEKKIEKKVLSEVTGHD